MHGLHRNEQERGCSAETAEIRQERLTKHRERGRAGIVKFIFSRGTQLLKIWLPPLIDHMGIFLRDNNLKLKWLQWRILDFLSDCIVTVASLKVVCI